MQSWMEAFLSTDKPKPDEIDQQLLDFGFYHRPIEVQRMYAAKVNHNMLGYSGGVIDQPEEYWHDMATMSWLQLWVEINQKIIQLPQEDVIKRLKQGGSLNGG